MGRWHRFEPGVLAAGVAEAHAAAAVGQAAKAFCEDLAAYPVEDHVGGLDAEILDQETAIECVRLNFGTLLTGPA